MVFVGFTSASTAGLWIRQRNLIQNEVGILRSSADSVQECLAASLARVQGEGLQRQTA